MNTKFSAAAAILLAINNLGLRRGPIDRVVELNALPDTDVVPAWV